MNVKVFVSSRILISVFVALLFAFINWPVGYQYSSFKLSSSSDLVIATLNKAELPMPVWVGRANYERWLNEAVVEVFKPNFSYVSVVNKTDGQIVTLGWPIKEDGFIRADLNNLAQQLRGTQVQKLLSAPVGYKAARIRELEAIKKKAATEYLHLREMLIDARKIAKEADIQDDLQLGEIDEKLLFTIGEVKLQKTIEALTLVIKNPELYIREAMNISAEQQRYEARINAFIENYPLITFENVQQAPKGNYVSPLVRALIVSGLLGILTYSLVSAENISRSRFIVRRYWIVIKSVVSKQ